MQYNPSEFALIYQRFLNLAHAMNNLNDYPKLYAGELCLLRHLNHFWTRQQKIKVVQIINAIDNYSPATVFKLLKQLKSKDYIQFEVDAQDNRVKYIEPTAQTMDYFAEHGKLMVQSTMQATSPPEQA